MKNTATIAICHLVVLKTYVDVSEPYAPMSCLLQCGGKLSDAPINPQKHKHWPKPPTWADAKLTAAGTGRCAGGVCLGARPQAAGVRPCLRMNGGTTGRVCFLVGGHQAGLLLRVQTPCACCCAGCPQEQAPSSPPAHPTNHGRTWPCRAVLCHQVPLVPPACWAGATAITSAAWRGSRAPVPCPVPPGGVTVPPGASGMLEVEQGWSWEHLAGLGAPGSSQTCPRPPERGRAERVGGSGRDPSPAAEPGGSPSSSPRGGRGRDAPWPQSGRQGGMREARTALPCPGARAWWGCQTQGSALGAGGRELSASQEKCTDLRQWRS